MAPLTPVVLFTMGLFLLARPAPPWRLVVAALLWALVGGSAALLLGVPQDWPPPPPPPPLLRQHASRTAWA